MCKPEVYADDVADDEDGADIDGEAAELLALADHVVLGDVAENRCEHHG